MSVILSIGSIS